MFFTLTCKQKGEGVCSDFFLIYSATSWWKDCGKITSMLLSHPSSVVKVGVMSSCALEDGRLTWESAAALFAT